MHLFKRLSGLVENIVSYWSFTQFLYFQCQENGDCPRFQCCISQSSTTADSYPYDRFGATLLPGRLEGVKIITNLELMQDHLEVRMNLVKDAEGMVLHFKG